MKRYNIKSLTYLLFLSLFLGSCEKGNDIIEYQSTIYFPQSGLSKVELLWGESTYALAVYRAGINQSQKKFEVSVVYDQEGGEAFINDSTNYKLLPEEYYSLPGEKVSINSNEERAFFNLSFTKVNEEFRGAKYILPLKIENVSPAAEVLAEKNTVILHFDYRNGYGGPYRAIGTVSSPDDATDLRVDDYYDAKSIGEHTVIIPGPISGMKVKLTVNNGVVQVSAAEGSEKYNIKTVEGKCTYQGGFSQKYQRNKGDFKLTYTYEIQKTLPQEETWVYTVDEVLKFWLN